MLSCCEQQLLGPVSFPDLLTSRLDPLRDVPHVVLRPEVLEVGEEVDNVVATNEVVRLLLEPSKVVLKKETHVRKKLAMKNNLLANFERGHAARDGWRR